MLVSLTGFTACANDKYFYRLGVEDGLPQSWVRTIIQDTEGFIWVGTKKGLSRYDGYTFRTYSPDNNNLRGLLNASVNELYIDSDNQLWVCTLNGVYAYDPGADKFVIFEPSKGLSTTCVLRSTDNAIWIGTTEGLYCYNPGSGEMEEFLHDPLNHSSISANTISSIFQDSRSRIWISTQKGLDVFISGNGKGNFLHPTDGSGSGSVQQSQINSVFEDPEKRIWIATDEGLFQFPDYEEVPDGEVLKKLQSGSVQAMAIDNEKTFWIGFSSGRGLELWTDCMSSSAAEVREKYLNIAHDRFSLSDNSVTALFKDNRGGMWIGTYGNGLNYYNPNHKKFFSRNSQSLQLGLEISDIINCFLVEENEIWIGSENGLLRYDRQTGTYHQYSHDPEDKNSLGSNAIYDITRDSRGNLWIGGWNSGLNRYLPESDSFIRFTHDNYAPQSITNNNVFCIFEDRQQRLWLGTIGGGLNVYDYETDIFNAYVNIPTDDQTLKSSYVNDIVQTPDGALWVSTFNSLELFDPETGVATHFTQIGGESIQNQGEITDLFVDSLGQLWLGTQMGLIEFNRETQTCFQYTVMNGLISNSVQFICEDSEGNLWITTNKGLSKFVDGIQKPGKPEFRNYTRDDGLSGNEFVKRSGYVSPDGVIYLGGTKGYTYFKPEDIQPNQIIPPIKITDFFLSDNRVFPDPESPVLKLEPYLAESIHLTYQQDIFSFQYSALSYPWSRGIKYAYMLEGFDREWHTNTTNTATYTNMDPGNYRFIVKSTNDDGDWVDNHVSIGIVISPPWWQLFWVRIIAILLVCLFLFSIYRYRVYSLRKTKIELQRLVNRRTRELSLRNRDLADAKEELSSQNVELIHHRDNLEQIVRKRTRELEKARDRAQESERLKSAFIANMSHEIRTPLNAIVGFSNLISLKVTGNEELRDFATRIDENTEMLLQLLNDIIDLSVIESGQIQLRKGTIDARGFYQAVSSEFQSLVKRKLGSSVSYIEDCRLKSNLQICFESDRFRFKQILYNLLANACKYTDKGSITFGLDFDESDKMLEFWIEDTGIGIESQYHTKIFERFSKIENKDRSFAQGTGLGLSICRNLAGILGCTICVDSTPGRGSKFSILQPVDNMVTGNGQSHQFNQKNKKSTVDKVDWKGKTILVAEDVDTNFDLLEAFLLSTGVKLVHARDGQEVIDLMKSMDVAPDLLLLDIKMPKMSGDEALREIRKWNSSVPAIAQTAYAFKDELDGILNAGFQACISKPIRFQNLIQTVEEYIN